MVKNPPALQEMQEYWFDPRVGMIPWRRKWKLTAVFLPRQLQWTEDPGSLQSKGLQRVRYNWAHTQSCKLLTDWWHTNLCSGIIIIRRNLNCSLWSLTYGVDMLSGIFSQLGLQMCYDIPVLFKSGCWSKPNLRMHPLLFVFFFSFNISIL